MRRGASLAVVLLWGASAQALTPVAQDRHVFGQEEDGLGHIHEALGYLASETRSAPDYGPFSASTDGWAFPPQFGEGAEIFAAQSSTIGADQLDASGNTRSWPYTSSTDGRRVIGESVYSVTFEVESPRPYTLTGQIDLELRYCWGTTEGRIRLTGPSGVLAQVSHQMTGYISTANQVSLPLSTALLLPAGTYTLEARGKTDALGADTPVGYLCAGWHTSRYEVHLAPAAPEVPALPGALAPLLALALALVARRSRAMT